MKEFSLTGEWYFPSNETETYIGNLKFSQETGGTLEIFTNGQEWDLPLPVFCRDADSLGNSFILGPGDLTPKELPEKVILGHGDNGKHYTLIANEVGVKASLSSGLGKKVVKIDFIFEGAVLPDILTRKFPQVTLQISGLFEWIGRSILFAVDFPYQQKKEWVPVKLKQKDDIVFELESGLSLSFKNSFNTQCEAEYSLKEYSITQISSLILERVEGFDYNEILTITHSIKNFISFGLNQPCFTEEIACTFEKNKPPCYLLFSQLGEIDNPIKHKEINNNFRRRGFYFFLPDIQDVFPAIFESYLHNLEKNGSLLRAFFFVKNKIKYFEPDLKFTNYIETFEALHRLFQGGEYTNKEDFESIAHKLKEAIPDELGELFKNSIASRISYAYEFSLRTRLKKFLQKYSRLFPMGKNQRNQLSQDIKDTRNYYAHGRFDKNMEKIKEEKLYWVCQLLEEMVAVIIFEALGFKSDKIDLFLKNKRRCSSYKWQDKIFPPEPTHEK